MLVFFGTSDELFFVFNIMIKTKITHIHTKEQYDYFGF